MVDGPRPSGWPSPVPELWLLARVGQSTQRHAHPAGMTRDPYFAVQGGSGSADAATTRCRAVRKQHQIPGGVLVSDDQHYDVIVIGFGAGGGTLTHRLAPTGKRVLLLERGDYLPRERANWDSTRGIRQ